MKVLINVCHGGFGISDEALLLWAQKKNITLVKQTSYTTYSSHHYYTDGDQIVTGDFIERDDPTLIEVFEELGSKRTSGDCAQLSLVEIPDGCKYNVTEYDGWESISTWISVTIEELTAGLSTDKLVAALKADSIRLKRTIERT